MIAINICSVNAQVAAGQDNPVDILMNSTGLLILNDMDNIIGVLFEFNKPDEDHKDEEEDECHSFSEHVAKLDRLFGLCIVFPHGFLVFYYSLWFLGMYEVGHPMNGLAVV